MSRRDLFKNQQATLDYFDCRLSLPRVTDQELHPGCEIVYEELPTGYEGCHTPTRYKVGRTIKVLRTDGSRCCAILQRDGYRCVRKRSGNGDYCSFHAVEFKETGAWELAKERGLALAHSIGVAK